LVNADCHSADAALAFYVAQGFDADRTRMNTFGYPGMLRDLNSPPPWVEVEPEDAEDDLSQERQLALRPLVEYANGTSEAALVAEWLAEQERTHFINTKFHEAASSVVTRTVQEEFSRLITLAKTLGVEAFRAVLEAVFDFDEFVPAPGAPDLLVWLPRAEPPLWLFSEVKGPRDALRSSQKAWLHQHWELVQGHYLLTILE
jgi:hypothetical protein